MISSERILQVLCESVEYVEDFAISDKEFKYPYLCGFLLGKLDYIIAELSKGEKENGTY